MAKVKNWQDEWIKLARKVGRFAVITWSHYDHLLGTDIKKIYVYEGEYVVDIRPYSEVEVTMLKKYMPVVDSTKGRPYPETYSKVPPTDFVLGRLHLLDLYL